MYDPKTVKDKYPEVHFMSAEQTFAWLARFRRILCAMSKHHHLFYLHRLVKRRNKYTERCHKLLRQPLLPKTIGQQHYINIPVYFVNCAHAINDVMTLYLLRCVCQQYLLLQKLGEGSQVTWYFHFTIERYFDLLQRIIVATKVLSQHLHPGVTTPNALALYVGPQTGRPSFASNIHI